MSLEEHCETQFAFKTILFTGKNFTTRKCDHMMELDHDKSKLQMKNGQVFFLLTAVHFVCHPMGFAGR